MKDLKFEKFRSTRVIEAIAYEEGMEDGFAKRWRSAKPNEDGSYSTYGIYAPDDAVEVDVPYILNEENRQVLVGQNYMIIRNGTVVTAKPTHIFNKEYEQIID